MSSVAFDTLEFVEHLKDAGVPEKQAKAIAEAQQQAFFQVLDTSLATKTDLMPVKSELHTDLLALKSEFHTELLAVKSELQSELKLLKWMLAVVILVSVILTPKAVFA